MRVCLSAAILPPWHLTEIIGNLGEIYTGDPSRGKGGGATLDKLNEIAPTCFITGARGSEGFDHP